MTDKNTLILIVDDEPDICWIISKILSNAGYRTKTTCSGKEALSIATDEPVSVAVLDYRLPDTNGIALSKRLRKINPNISGILITAYGSKALEEKALKHGFSYYFDKPIDNQELVDSIRHIITPSPMNE